MRAAVGLVAAVLGLSGCTRLASTFACEESSQCQRGGASGTCEPNGACSFPDLACPSGRRYAELAPEGGTCVEGSPADGGDTRADGPPVDAAVRTTDGLVALYTFSSADGGRLLDTSGVDPALDLALGGGATLLDGALVFEGGDPAAVSNSPATKIQAECENTDELTVEAWVLPAADKTTETGVITGLMIDFQTRNVQLSEDRDRYRQWLRSDATTGGAVSGDFATEAGTVVPVITHLVATRTAAGDRAIWLDGELAATMVQPGSLDPWSTYALYVGNNPVGTDDYEGRIELVAYYCRALTEADVRANFAAGPDVGDE